MTESNKTTFVTNATKTDTDGVYSKAPGEYIEVTNPIEGAPAAADEAASHIKAQQGVVGISKRDDDPEFSVTPRDEKEIFRGADALRAAETHPGKKSGGVEPE